MYFCPEPHQHGSLRPILAPVGVNPGRRGGGIVGIHGTNQPGLIPGKISHGCVRVPNANILKLNKLMKVGTPLTVT